MANSLALYLWKKFLQALTFGPLISIKWQVEAPTQPGFLRERKLHIVLNFRTSRQCAKSSVCQDTVLNICTVYLHLLWDCRSFHRNVTFAFLSGFLNPKSPGLHANKEKFTIHTLDVSQKQNLSLTLTKESECQYPWYQWHAGKMGAVCCIWTAIHLDTALMLTIFPNQHFFYLISGR